MQLAMMTELLVAAWQVVRAVALPFLLKLMNTAERHSVDDRAKKAPFDVAAVIWLLEVRIPTAASSYDLFFKQTSQAWLDSLGLTTAIACITQRHNYKRLLPFELAQQLRFREQKHYLWRLFERDHCLKDEANIEGGRVSC